MKNTASFTIKFIVTTTIAVLLSYCKPAGEAASEPGTGEEFFLTNQQIKTAHIAWAAPVRKDIVSYLECAGTIDVPPQNIASVTAPLPGYVENVFVLPGQHVHKGEILATLSHPGYLQLQQEYIQSWSKSIFLEKEYERQNELMQSQVGAVRDFQLAEADFKAARAVTNLLEGKLKMIGVDPTAVRNGNVTPQIKLRSPLNGFIKTASATIGKYATAEQPLFEMVDLSHKHAELLVYEKDIRKVQEGQSVTFYQVSDKEKTYEGTVYLIGKTLDPVTKAIGIHVHFSEQVATVLLPGMYVTARIEVGRKATNTVPESAVWREGENISAFTVKKITSDGVYFNKINLGKGSVDGGLAEIQDTTLNTAQFVTQGAYFISAEAFKDQEEE